MKTNLTHRDISCRNASAFTLVELLTVIAIIGLLAAIMIPVAGKVRETARQAVCLSNLRQLGNACLLFENDNKLLPAAWSPWGNSGPDNSWWYHISPYVIGRQIEKDWNKVNPMLSTGVFRCPVVDPKAGPPGVTSPQFSYKMNRNFLDGGADVTRRLEACTHPATTLLLADGRQHMLFTTWDSTQAWSQRVDYRHGGKCAVVFLDGHTALFTETRLKDNWLVFYRPTS
jgi:general secretion pathway protein G